MCSCLSRKYQGRCNHTNLNPSCRQTTAALTSFQPSSHTLPHWPFMKTSTLPSFLLSPATKRTRGPANKHYRKKKNMLLMIIHARRVSDFLDSHLYLPAGGNKPGMSLASPPLLQRTPTSSLWEQSCWPHSEWVQSSRVASVPRHWTSSSRISPLPSSYTLSGATSARPLQTRHDHTPSVSLWTVLLMTPPKL